MEGISSKKKVVMGIALVVLIGIALLIKVGGGAAAKLAEQMLAHQNIVDGEITYEHIGAGMAGDVEIRDLTWKAPNGTVKAEVPLVTLSVNFFDVLRKGAGTGSVSNVVLNKPHFYGVYEEGKGLDILDLVRFAHRKGVPNEREGTIVPTKFRGLVEIKDGLLDLESNGKKVNFTKISTQSAFKQYPLIRSSATARKDDCDLVVNMDYKDGAAKVTGEAKNTAAADLLALYPDLKQITLTDGTVPSMKLAASKDDKGWHMQLDGRAEKLAGKVFGWDLTEGVAEFTATRDEALIRKLDAKVNGMPVSVQGKITSGRGTPLPPGFDLTFKSDAFRTQAVSEGMVLHNAALKVVGRVSGSALEPKLDGSFTSDKVQAGLLPLTQVKGGFELNAGKLVLKDTEAKLAGGNVSVDGFVGMENRDYQFRVRASQVDAAMLTQNKLTGLLTIRVNLLGRNTADSCEGAGFFSLPAKGRFFYDANGKEASGEVRLLQGDILVKDAVMTTRNAQMKLGRNKYAIEVVPQDDSYAEIRLGDVISSSWF
ncbi:MAG: hypothetical protein VZQ81_04365 [Succiniclasticum sp.]|nr:hypothetical protein [Succiniclasticum sp.]MEE3479241.1 hypothetical protein [Succiniclasticum sp.]